jgi:hypothetical protein
MKRKINYKKPDSNSYDGTKADRYTADELMQFSQHSTNTLVGGSLFRQYGIFCCCKANGLFWFRVFGYGLHFKNIKKRFLLFSERNGYRKRLQIGNWSIRTLVP